MAKKARKARLPKHIGGVKVPKELRKAGGAAARLLDHPMVGEIVSAGLIAAAAAFTQTDTARRGARATGEAANDGGEKARRKAGRVKVAVKAAAGAIGKSLLDEFKASKRKGR